MLCFCFARRKYRWMYVLHWLSSSLNLSEIYRLKSKHHWFLYQLHFLTTTTCTLVCSTRCWFPNCKWTVASCSTLLKFGWMVGMGWIFCISNVNASTFKASFAVGDFSSSLARFAFAWWISRSSISLSFVGMSSVLLIFCCK